MRAEIEAQKALITEMRVKLKFQEEANCSMTGIGGKPKILGLPNTPVFDEEEIATPNRPDRSTYGPARKNWNCGDQQSDAEDEGELESEEEHPKPQPQLREDIMSYRYFKGGEEEAKDREDPNFFHNPFNALQQ